MPTDVSRYRPWSSTVSPGRVPATGETDRGAALFPCRCPSAPTPGPCGSPHGPGVRASWPSGPGATDERTAAVSPSRMVPDGVGHR
ncbi:hypothetical protein NKG05_06155 [Oerskovia sp. M15]